MQRRRDAPAPSRSTRAAGLGPGTNARRRGPQPPPPHLYQRHRAANTLLGLAALATCEDLYLRNELDPMSWSILDVLSTGALAPACLLAWTKCRYNELARLNLAALVDGRAIDVPASKHGRSRRIPGYHMSVATHWLPVDPATPITLISYDALCARLKRAQQRAGIQLPRNAKDKTHVFRHLHASWRAAEGYPLEAISAELGHHSSSSTEKYIHPLPHLKMRT